MLHGLPWTCVPFWILGPSGHPKRIQLETGVLLNKFYPLPTPFQKEALSVTPVERTPNFWCNWITIITYAESQPERGAHYNHELPQTWVICHILAHHSNRVIIGKGSFRLQRRFPVRHLSIPHHFQCLPIPHTCVPGLSRQPSPPLHPNLHVGCISNKFILQFIHVQVPTIVTLEWNTAIPCSNASSGPPHCATCSPSCRPPEPLRIAPHPGINIH